MTNADYFDRFLRALSQDRKLAWRLDRIVHRTQKLNIDFRGDARQDLHWQAEQLARRLVHRYDQVRTINMSIVDNTTSAVGIAKLIVLSLGSAGTRVAQFRDGLNASVLDPEREPRLGVLPDAVCHLEHAAVEMARLAGIFAESERKVTRPLRMSQQVANLAVRLLPWEQRERYLNEYLSELDELVQDDSVSRRTQLRYALRLLVRTPALRLALRTPVPDEYAPMTTARGD